MKRISSTVERAKTLSLLEAIVKSDEEAVAELIRDPECDLNRVDTGVTPLLVSVFLGKHDIMQMLLSAGADVDYQNDYRATALHIAAERGDITAMEILLQEGATLDLVNKQLATPLHVAVYNKRFDCISLLLDIGANINVKDNEGRTALHLAVMQNYPVGVQLLLDNEARILRDKEGKSPLDYATSREMEYILKNICPPTKDTDKFKTTNKSNTTLYDELTNSESFAQISQEVIELLKESQVTFTYTPPDEEGEEIEEVVEESPEPVMREESKEQKSYAGLLLLGGSVVLFGYLLYKYKSNQQ